MPDDTRPDSNKPVVYEIRVKGQLGPQWVEWFGDLHITLDENGDTLLRGPIADQAALYGVLKRVRDLGIPLLSVNYVATPGAEESPPVRHIESVQNSGHAASRHNER